MTRSQLRPFRGAVHRPCARRREHHRTDRNAESVKARVNWEQFFTAEIGPLKGRGVWRDLLCPFHGDTRPSLRVNVQTGRYWCPVCAAHGDGIGFLMERDGLSFADALKALEGFTA
jgi:DNA primase